MTELLNGFASFLMLQKVSCWLRMTTSTCPGPRRMGELLWCPRTAWHPDHGCHSAPGSLCIAKIPGLQLGFPRVAFSHLFFQVKLHLQTFVGSLLLQSLFHALTNAEIIISLHFWDSIAVTQRTAFSPAAFAW